MIAIKDMDLRKIPCISIANGWIIGDSGDPINEDDPDIRAELDRRGWDIYRNHGYGDGHNGIPVAGCDHSEEQSADCNRCGTSPAACSWSQNPTAGRGDCCPDCQH